MTPTTDHKKVLRTWTAKLAIRRTLLRSAVARKADAHTLRVRRHQVAAAERIVERHRKLAAEDTLQERAYREAQKLIGVMEQGGNNRGPGVEKIINFVHGQAGAPWCGYTMAYVYTLAGSKAVTWKWAAVRLYLPGPGLTRTDKPVRGDLVRYKFDHIGMFVKDNGDGTITTIEGNTGPVGAVSDSKTGGDGVYVKVRSKTLVSDYVHVTL